MIRIITNRQREIPLPRPPRRAILMAPAVVKVPVYTSHKMDDIKRLVTKKARCVSGGHFQPVKGKVSCGGTEGVYPKAAPRDALER